MLAGKGELAFSAHRANARRCRETSWTLHDHRSTAVAPSEMACPSQTSGSNGGYCLWIRRALVFWGARLRLSASPILGASGDLGLHKQACKQAVQPMLEHRLYLPCRVSLL